MASNEFLQRLRFLKSRVYGLFSICFAGLVVILIGGAFVLISASIFFVLN